MACHPTLLLVADRPAEQGVLVLFNTKFYWPMGGRAALPARGGRTLENEMSYDLVLIGHNVLRHKHKCSNPPNFGVYSEDFRSILRIQRKTPKTGGAKRPAWMDCKVRTRLVGTTSVRVGSWHHHWCLTVSSVWWEASYLESTPGTSQGYIWLHPVIQW